jgi:hypothetical protein
MFLGEEVQGVILVFDVTGFLLSLFLPWRIIPDQKNR